MLVSNASFREILEEGDAPPSLYSVLEKKCNVSPDHPDNSRKSRTGFDIEIDTLVDTCIAVLSFLASLISWQSAGFDRLALGVVLAAGGVDIVHSLFLVNGSEYEEALPEVWGIVGDIPKDRFLILTKLTSMLFVTNITFTATSSSKFKSHVTGLSLVLPQDFDSNAHQPALANDDKSRPIISRGAAFIPATTALAILDLDGGASIAEAASIAFSIINASGSTSFNTASDWLQASFNTRANGVYISDTIRT